ncbi:glycosyltransferase [Marinobacter sp. R17]|uniref:glycosyltransferase n=1 Tax=Marinobacter sp. R17 TaxID=2484250 RepID=UPI000F4BC340|nr:glycosyltransferase [Marinobacter sp. R17]ROT98382.1 glycosyltransferase [Marinobacter sp. R17]
MGKVLHLIDSGGLYGAEKMLLTLVSQQLAMGLSPMILSAGELDVGDKAIEVEARRLGLPVHPWRMRPGFNPSEALRILRWAQAEGYELLHSHGYKFNVLMGMWPAFMRRLPMVATLHGYVKAARYTRAWLYEALDRLVLRRLNRIVVVSEAMRFDIPPGIARSSLLTVIPNGLDTESLRESANTELSEELQTFIDNHHPVLLGVGRLSREKGFERLVGALSMLKSRFPGIGLMLIGEGRERQALTDQIVAEGLQQQVIMPGYCNTVPALMAACDVLCMPSRTEGLPISLLEAMALELPVVASNVGEIGAVLGNDFGGYLVDATESASVAKSIVECLSDEAERDKRVAWARSRVERDFSGEAMFRGYMAIYEQVLR